jgi:FtsH-binding integral membrane protein
LINFFWQNSTFNIYLNIFALIIFSGLVIWDIAVLKQMALLQDRRVEIVMALALYLDFINIFITLLKLFGNNRE